MASKTNKTGFVGGMDIPVITRFLAGYYAGARYITPDCEVIVSYVGSWIDLDSKIGMSLMEGAI